MPWLKAASKQIGDLIAPKKTSVDEVLAEPPALDARLERAKGMGFDTETVLYHGMSGELEGSAFKPSSSGSYGAGVYFSSMEGFAKQYATLRSIGEEGEPNVIKTYVRGKFADSKEWFSRFDKGMTGPEVNAALRERGFDGVRIGNETVVFDPANIRSVNAEFDLDNKFSSNISGGADAGPALAAGAIAGGALLSGEAEGREALYDVRNFPILEQQGYWEPLENETIEQQTRREIDHQTSRKAYERWAFEQANTNIAQEIREIEALSHVAKEYSATRKESKAQKKEFQEKLESGEVFQGDIETPEEARPWDVKRRKYGGALDTREMLTPEEGLYSAEGLPKGVQRRLAGRIGEQVEYGADEGFLNLLYGGMGGPEISVKEGRANAGDAEQETSTFVKAKKDAPAQKSNWIPNKPISPSQFRAVREQDIKSPMEIVNDDKPTHMDIWGAAFRRENVVGSLLSGGTGRNELGTFNPYFDPSYLEGYEDYADRFQNAFTQIQADELKARIDREREDLQAIELGGWEGVVASITAGTLDPTIFIPVGGTIKKGDSLLRVTRLGIQGAVGGAVASESLLQTTQLTRTKTESGFAVGGAFVLGGALGAASKPFLKSPAGQKLTTKFEDEMVLKGDQDPMLSYEQADTKAMQSAGAAAVEPTATLESEALAPAIGLAEAGGKVGLNPILRLGRSQSAKAREISNQLMENGMFLGRNSKSKGSPLASETAMREWSGHEAKSLTAYRKIFKEMNKSIKADPNDPSKGMTITEFSERVGLALRRGDKDLNGNQYVTKAAQEWRKTLDVMKNEAIGIRLLPEDVDITEADSYFHRMWNRKALKANSPKFTAMTSKWLKGQFNEILEKAHRVRVDAGVLGAKLNDTDKTLVETADELQKLLDIEGSLDAYALQTANDIYKTLTGLDQRTLPSGLKMVPNARGPLAERTFHIPDLFEADGTKVEDFLVNDVEEVMSRYMRVMSADIEIARSFGDRDMKGAIDAISEDYKKLIDAAKTEKARTDLDNQRAKAIKDVEGVRDVLRGTYGNPADFSNQFARAGAVVRNWNYMTLLGGMTVSALPDVANKVLSNGFKGIARDLMVPLVTDWRKMKLAKNEARDFGVAVERVLNQRVMAIADIGDPYGKGTSFERTVDAVGNRFSKYTGMQLWNDVMKTADYVMAQNRAIRTLQSNNPSKKDSRWLAWAGVGLDDTDGMATRIRRQIEKYGDTDGNMKLAGLDKWDDREAQRVFKGVMAKEAATVTVTPGAGDKLLASNTNVGKTLLQFKTFAFAANQRVMIRAAQQGRELDGAVASYMTSAILLGMIVYWFKMEDSLRQASTDPETLIREGVDRSGMIPIIFETFNTAEKLTGQSFIGESPSSRYASRGAFSAMLGPSVGKGEDIANLIKNFSDGELKDKDIHAIRKLLPFNNLAVARRVLDKLEMEIIEMTGAEQTAFSKTKKAALEGAD